MKLKFLLIQIFIILAIFQISSSQSVISYMTPDIGAPGMAVYVELIGPYNLKNNFGFDGVYTNKNQDIELIPFEESDYKKIKIGPLVVSWEGRMLSTIIYINDSLQPNSEDALMLNNEFKIKLQVRKKGDYSETVTFYIVKSRPYLDLTTNTTDLVFGEGLLGKRSPRGAMIFDSLKLGGRKYRVSTEDCDPYTDGNQGFLPFVLLSKGKIEGANASTVIALNGGELGNGMIQDAAAGGGGGGGSFKDDASGMGARGGDGFTGGGAGGRNRSGVPFASDAYTSPSMGTGKNLSTDNNTAGYSLNKLPGPLNYAYEAAGGGTGHPFGLSGSSCNNGDLCEPVGAYGGGSGWKQNTAGGSGGYATAGSNTTMGGSNGGKANGNVMVVPIAGGSGGASGNPQCFGGQSGAGGGGGGAIRIFAREFNNIVFEAKGAGGADNGCNGSFGGSGSGGHIGVQAKLDIQNVASNVDGGINSKTVGGAGRIRYDYPKSTNLRIYTADASNYRGPTTDTSHIIKRNHILTGSQDAGKLTLIYGASTTSDWKIIDTAKTENWTIDLTNFLNNTAGTYYIAAATIIDNPNISDYSSQPHLVLSQAAANILSLTLRPYIGGDRLIKSTAIHCAGEEVILKAKIWNREDADGELIVDLNDIWILGNHGFKLIGPKLNNYVIKPGDTAEIVVSFRMPVGDDPKQTFRDTLIIPSNDPDFPGGKDWYIAYTVSPAFIGELDFAGTPSPYQLADTRVGQFTDFSYTIRNSGDSKLYITSVQDINPPFSLLSTIPTLPSLLDVGETITLNIRFSPTSQGDFVVYPKVVGIASDTTCPVELTAEIKASGLYTDIDVNNELDFGLISHCDTKLDSLLVGNKSLISFRITSFAQIVGPNAKYFEILNNQTEEILVQPGGSTVYKIIFKPDNSLSGVITATMILTTDIDGFDTVKVTLKAEVVKFDVIPKPIVVDFGLKGYGENFDSNFTLHNLSKLDERISKVYSLKPQLTILDVADSLLKALDSNSIINYRFKSTIVGNFEDTIFVVFDEPCLDTVFVIVRANVQKAIPSAKLNDDTIIYNTVFNEERIPEFGSLLICNTGGVIESDVIYYNYNQISYKVLKEEIIDTTGRFKIVSNGFGYPQTIDLDSTIGKKGIKIQFDSKDAAAGEYNFYLRITLLVNGDTIVYNNIKPRVKIEQGVFRLSPSNPITYKTIINIPENKTLNIANLGPYNLELLSHTGPFTPYFTIATNPDGQIITRNNSLDFVITFTPTFIGNYSDSIVFVSKNSGCDSIFVIYLEGIGDPSKELTIWLPDTLNEMPDIDNYKLPVYGKFKKPDEFMNNIGLTFDLTFNRTLFYPTSVEGGRIISNTVVNNDRIVRIAFDNFSIDSTNHLVGHIVGHTMLGDETFTNLTLSNSLLTNKANELLLHTENGKLSIIVCSEGGNRLLSHQYKAMKINVNPNPTSDRIVIMINTLEKGNHKMIISDVLGNEVYVQDWYADSAGLSKEFNYNANNLAEGSYFVRVISPNDQSILKIMVIK